jgi:hypothetical protein
MMGKIVHGGAVAIGNLYISVTRTVIWIILILSALECVAKNHGRLFELMLYVFKMRFNLRRRMEEG